MSKKLDVNAIISRICLLREKYAGKRGKALFANALGISPSTYNYYEQDKNKVDGKLEINLDEVVTDLTYPIAQPVDGLIQKPEVEIVALNKVVLTLLDVQHVDNGLQFDWQTSNPGEYPTYLHIGNPPVIGDDGILYGFYETPDIVDVPITPSGDIAEWTTEVAVPEDVNGFYIMLSVESGKARLFENYAIDITDK